MTYDPNKEHAIEELKNRGYNINTAWDIVDIFEKKVAEYAGSKYAIAVDNCTDAIFLCLKYLKAKDIITIPAQTYVSLPSVIKHAGCEFKFEELKWSGVYQLKPYPIYDSALRFTKNMYIEDSFQCLSFHRKKTLKMVKGGMILTNDKEASEWFKQARAVGRHPHNGTLYENENFTVMGWNMYMAPEYAAQGILLFDQLPEINSDAAGYENYTDLRKYKIFQG